MTDIRKDMVYEHRSLHSLNGELIEDAIATLREKSEGLTNPTLDLDIYDGYAEWNIAGYRPKNEKELEQERKKKELDKENARKAREQQKKAEWTLAQNLYNKYKDKLEKLDESERPE